MSKHNLSEVFMIRETTFTHENITSPEENRNYLPIKRMATSIGGVGFPIAEQGLEDEQYPLYKVNALGQADHDGIIRDRYDTISHETARKLGAKIIPNGSLVMAKIGAALMLGRIRILAHDSCIDNNMLALVPNMKLAYNRYLFYALHGINMELFVNPGAVPTL